MSRSKSVKLTVDIINEYNFFKQAQNESEMNDISIEESNAIVLLRNLNECNTEVEKLRQIKLLQSTYTGQVAFNYLKHISSNMEVLFSFLRNKHREKDPCSKLPHNLKLARELGFDPGSVEAAIATVIDLYYKEES